MLASPTASGSVRDPVRALQHALYRAAKADPGRRFHSLWDKILRRDVLWRAWVMVRRNDGAPGIDKTTLVEVEEYGVDRLLDELANQLRAARYRPLPARRVFILKPGRPGERRPLSIPTVADRVVERALLEVLDAVIDPTLLPWSFAYRRGLGVKDALAALTEARDTGATWVARADIEDCFDRIPQWEVMRRLRAVVDDERVVHLVGAIVDRQVRGERAMDRGRGLHQGGVLSPLLSNLYLDTFDRRMLAAGFRVIRYGDDFAIPVDSRLSGERALMSASTELSDLRLELNAGKCRVASFDEGVRFLGETVTASTLAAAEALSHPTETSVYVDRQGSMVRVRGDRLVVTDGDESLLRLSLNPPMDVW